MTKFPELNTSAARETSEIVRQRRYPVLRQEQPRLPDRSGFLLTDGQDTAAGLLDFGLVRLQNPHLPQRHSVYRWQGIPTFPQIVHRKRLQKLFLMLPWSGARALPQNQACQQMEKQVSPPILWMSMPPLPRGRYAFGAERLIHGHTTASISITKTALPASFWATGITTMLQSSAWTGTARYSCRWKNAEMPSEAFRAAFYTRPFPHSSAASSPSLTRINGRYR